MSRQVHLLGIFNVKSLNKVFNKYIKRCEDTGTIICVRFLQLLILHLITPALDVLYILLTGSN